MIADGVKALGRVFAGFAARSMQDEILRVRGEYTFTFRDKFGRVIGEVAKANTVVTVGKNQLLDAALAGAAYTVVGPYMGLISSVSFTGINVADVMTSHTGWLEAGLANAPTYTAPRKTCVWSAASAGAKALSAGLVFTFTGTGTVQGAFIVYGTGALSTIDNTAGVLLSAAVLAPTRAVIATDTLTVSYTLTLT